MNFRCHVTDVKTILMWRSSCGSVVMSPSSIHGESGFSSRPRSVGQGPGVAGSCGEGRRCGSDLVWLRLWHRPAAASLIWPQTWELTYAAAAALKKKKKKKNPLPHFITGDFEDIFPNSIPSTLRGHLSVHAIHSQGYLGLNHSPLAPSLPCSHCSDARRLM